MFAREYFKKSNRFKPLVTAPPSAKTTMIIVIPCLQEPDLLLTLESLSRCTPPDGKCEVLILINEPENCPGDISCFNERTHREAVEWINRHPLPHLNFHSLGPVRLPAKWAGVGLARKAGMDEALFRFDQMEKPDGIIVSLDADTLVDENYLIAIENHFISHSCEVGATLPFSHQTEGLTERQTRGILLYEEYLHYYKRALAFTGYPHAIYTIGSAFAVTAEAYLKRGGMTRRKAGEDFYFLQTLTQQGKVGEVVGTAVHPSARISQRVPFGTGPAMKKWMEGSDDLLYTYNPRAFQDLKILFDRRSELYQMSECDENLFNAALPPSVREFIAREKLMENWRQLSQNCSRVESFCDRFFHDFNAFRILKFLNFSHPGHYAKILLETVTL